MAAGLDSALSRIETVLTALGWTRSERRLTELEELSVRATVEQRFWVGSSQGAVGEPVHGTLADHRFEVTVELGRHLGADDLLEDDFAALERSLSSQGRTVEHSLLHPLNWAYTTTGLLLVNHRRSAATKRRPALIWTIELELTIRVANAAVVVPVGP